MDWGAFASQFLILFGPAYYLSARHDRIISTVLWAGALVYVNYLCARALGTYTYSSTFVTHVALSTFAYFLVRYLRRASNDDPAFNKFAAPALAHALQSPLIRAAWFAVAAITITGLLSNLRTPPGGWDALTYHLDFPAQWVRAQKIFLVPTGYGDYSPTYYPMLIEAFAGWFLLPGRGTGAVDLVQVLFVPLLYCALRDVAYYYVNRLDSARMFDAIVLPDGQTIVKISLAAECVPLLAISLPYLQSSLLVADNDFVLCALLATVWRGTLHRGFATPGFAAAAALTLAVKYTGAVYLAALLVAILPVLPTLTASPALRNQRASIAGVCTTLAIIGGLGGAQYIMNWFHTGNPLYPAIIEFGGVRIFDGYYPAAFFESHPFHSFDWYAFWTDPGLSLPLWLAAAVAPGIISAKLRPDGKISANPSSVLTFSSLLLVPLILFGAFYLLSPLRQFRLALPAVVLCTPALVFCGPLLDRLPARRRNFCERFARYAFICAVILHCGVTAARFAEVYGDPGLFQIHVDLSEISRATLRNALNQPRHTLLFFSMCAGVTGLVLLAVRITRRTPGRVIVGLFAGLIVPGLAVYEQTTTAYANAGLAQAYRVIETESARGETGNIGVIGANALLPFRGRRPTKTNSRDVYLLMNRPHGDAPLHKREESLRYDPETKTWLAIGTLAQRDIFERNLQRRNITTTIIATTPGTNGLWPAEYEWLRAATNPRWNCDTEFSNAISGDPGARIAICRRS